MFILFLNLGKGKFSNYTWKVKGNKRKDYMFFPVLLIKPGALHIPASYHWATPPAPGWIYLTTYNLRTKTLLSHTTKYVKQSQKPAEDLGEYICSIHHRGTVNLTKT